VCSSDLPIACSLNDAEFRDRRALARRTVLLKISSSRRIENGVIMEFESGESVRTDVETFVTLEQHCCGFLTFALSSDDAPSGAALTLSVTGPPEGAATVEMFARAVEGAVS